MNETHKLPQVLIDSVATAPLGAEGHRSRLRERFVKSGFAAFAPHEVLELLLTLAIPRRDVKPAAKALLNKFGSLKGVLEASREDLAEVEGVGEIAATAFHIIRATSELYLLQGATQEPLLNSYTALENFWRVRLSGLKHEVIEVAYLDKTYRLLPDGVERLEEGSIDAAAFNPQKLFKKALARGARYLVLAHNHPSGDLAPSAHDNALTQSLATAAKAIEIGLLDHWIIGGNGCFSYKKAGLL